MNATEEIIENVSEIQRREIRDDFLCAILTVKYKFNRVLLKDVAAELNILPASAKYNLKLMLTQGLITYDIEGTIHLTEQGLVKAEEVYNRRVFFENILIAAGVYHKTAKEDARNIEKVISSESYEKLKSFVKECF